MKSLVLIVALCACSCMAQDPNYKPPTPRLTKAQWTEFGVDLTVRSLDAWTSIQLHHYYPLVHESKFPGGEFVSSRPPLQWTVSLAIPSMEWLLVRKFNHHAHRRWAGVPWAVDATADGNAVIGNFNLLSEMHACCKKVR